MRDVGWLERRRRAALCGLALVAMPLAAAGQGTPDPSLNDAAESRSPPSIASSLPGNGDPGGVRAALAARGIKVNAIYTGELLGNVAGGIRRGGLYEAKLELNTTWDLERLAGVRGLSFFGNAFQIHRSAGISRDFVGALDTVSAIEALPTTRLSELWIEQKFLDRTLGLRVGQLTADAEFFIASYSLPFINSDFPAISKQNLPGGGPAYPLSTPGVRLRWDPNASFSLLAAAFNGDPAGRGGDPERLNRNGVNFRLQDPALLWIEAQYRYAQEDDAKDLAGTLRIGAWRHLGRFDDVRRDAGGVSLASPLSTGIARRLRGNSNVYGIIDQQLWRPEGGDAQSGITAFSRVGASPSDRNLISFYLDGGIVFSGLVPGRPRDLFGATALFSRLSRDLGALDRDAAAFGMPRGVRRSEIALEATYVAEITPGWSVQPDLQHIIRPGGKVSGGPGDPVPRNATVIGLRSTVIY